MPGPRIFLSYSHKDEVWKERLVTHLKVFVQEGLLDLWEDGQLQAGDTWMERLARALDDADVGVLLVSADFLTSDFVRTTEVPRLLGRRDRDGIRIVPVIARPCAWQEIAWLAAMQVRPVDAKPLSALAGDASLDQALTDIAREVAALGRKRIGGRGGVKSPIPSALSYPTTRSSNPRARLFPRLAVPDHLGGRWK